MSSMAYVLKGSSPRSRASSPGRPSQHSKRILGIVITFGGQWPHSTYMMPGGVTSPLDRAVVEMLIRHRRIYAMV